MPNSTMLPPQDIDFEEIEHELKIINRRAESSKYRLIRHRPALFHEGQRDRLLPSSASCPTLKSPSGVIFEALRYSQRGSAIAGLNQRASIRRRSSQRTHSRHSSIQSDKIRRAFQSIQKVPEALKHLRAFAPNEDASFEERLAEFSNKGERVAIEAAPEDLFRDLFGPKPASSPTQQSTSAPAQQTKPKLVHRLDASMDVFVDHGLLPRPVPCPQRYRSGYPAYNMRTMDATQRDMYAFAMQQDRLHKSQAKNIARERITAYRRARKYHRQLLEKVSQDAKAKARSRVKPS